ncbi:MAG: CapA family protein [Clostridiales bacterium]|nr:CapA family protein [Clostridiales bacterium]
MVKQKVFISILLICCMFFITFDSLEASSAEINKSYNKNSDEVTEEAKSVEKQEFIIQDETKPEDTRQEDVKQEEIKQEDIKKEETDLVDTKQETSTQQDTRQEETTAEKEKAQDPKPIYAGSIKLKKKVSMKVGEEYKLKVTLSEKNLSGDKVSFTSSDKNIVRVTKDGLLKAKHWGEATVTASLGKAKASCKVTVTKEVQITISAAGDVTLSSDIKQPKAVNFFSVYDKEKDNDYFFKNVKSIFEKDDMTIVNFEGTLSNRGSRVDKKWAFRGKPSYIDILTQGSVEAVAFANNHVKDYGEVSYTDTIESFKKAGIAYSSYSTVGVYEVKGIKIGMISIQECGVPKKTYEDTLHKAIKSVNKKKPDLLIVSFHWGIEYTFKPNKAQIELSRMAIDEGADLVLGHHPHVLQPIEKYKDSYIVYSLGNFCFGGNTNPPDKDTIIYQQTFTFRNDKLVPDDNVRIIPCSVSSVKTKNNYQPTPSKGSEKEGIIKRMNGYCKPYGISFDKEGKLMKKSK